MKAFKGRPIRLFGPQDNRAISVYRNCVFRTVTIPIEIVEGTKPIIGKTVTIELTQTDILGIVSRGAGTREEMQQIIDVLQSQINLMG